MGYEFFRHLRPITNGLEMIENDGQQLLNITHATNQTLIEGAEATGDDLKIKANTTDTRPFVLLEGGGDITFDSADDVNWAKTGVTYALLYGDANSAILKAQGANADLYLRTQGTGLVKFGTHAAITTETNSGFITILDAAGNSRKICVVS